MADPFLNQVALDIRPRGLGTSADYTNQSVNPSVSESILLTPISSIEFISWTGVNGYLQGSSSAGNTYVVNTGISPNLLTTLTIDINFSHTGVPDTHLNLIELRDLANANNPIPLFSVGLNTTNEVFSQTYRDYYLDGSIYSGSWTSRTYSMGVFDTTYRQTTTLQVVISGGTVTVCYGNNGIVLSQAITIPSNSLYSVTLLPTASSDIHLSNTRVTMAARPLMTSFPPNPAFGSGVEIVDTINEGLSIGYAVAEGAVNRIDENLTSTSILIEGAANRVDENLTSISTLTEGVVGLAVDPTMTLVSNSFQGIVSFATDSTLSMSSSYLEGAIRFVTDSMLLNGYEGTLNQYSITVTNQTYSFTPYVFVAFKPTFYTVIVDTSYNTYSSYLISYNSYNNNSFNETITELLATSELTSFVFNVDLLENLSFLLSDTNEPSAVISEEFILYGNTDPSVFLESTILELFNQSDSSVDSAQILEGFTDTLVTVSDSGVFTTEELVNEIISISELIVEWTNLSGLQEEIIDGLILNSSSLNTSTILSDILDLVKILDLGVIYYIEELNDLINSGSISIDIQNSLEKLLEKFNLYHTLYTNLSSINSIDEYLDILDEYKSGYSHLLEESINIVDSLDNILYVISNNVEILTIDGNVVHTNTILLKLSELIDTNTILNSTALFNYLVSEQFKMVGVTVKKDTVISSYTYQPETTSVTTYSNYNFTSSARFHKEYLFANENGLYLYGANTDDGVPITSTITTPAYDFGTSNLKSVSQVYLGLSTDNVIIMKVRVDGKAEVTYRLNKRTTDLQTLQIDIGKGLIGRYFQFEIITQADNFDLESIEFFPLNIGRKR